MSLCHASSFDVFGIIPRVFRSNSFLFAGLLFLMVVVWILRNTAGSVLGVLCRRIICSCRASNPSSKRKWTSSYAAGKCLSKSWR